MQQELVLEKTQKTQVVNFYESQIETYDNIDGFSYWEILYSEYSKWIKNNLDGFFNKIIELGCGTGLLTKTLEQKSNMVYGIDLCEKFLKKAYYNSSKSFSPICSDVLSLPYRDNSSDAVVCLNTFDHVNNIKNVFSEVKRINKDNGIFIFDITSSMALDPWSLFGINGKNGIKDIFNKLTKNTIQYNWQLKVDNNRTQKIVTYRHSPQFIERLLKSYGFEIINKRGIHLSDSIIPERIQVNSASKTLSKINRFCLGIDDKLNKIAGMKNCALYILYACKQI